MVPNVARAGGRKCDLVEIAQVVVTIDVKIANETKKDPEKSGLGRFWTLFVDLFERNVE